MPESTPPVELVIEWSGTARLRLTSEAQLPLAAGLLQLLEKGRPRQATSLPWSRGCRFTAYERIETKHLVFVKHDVQSSNLTEATL